MATTTNFGWETPDDTDLVKDGALAMRTLGNAIDASLVDLKGGTTGQVLSKNSNTDMDFTWVTSDDANAIQNAIVDAKGDLITATAADTPARLAVGSNGDTLVADSATSTGLKWQAPTVNTVIDAKGDLLAGTAADTIARLPVGTNGQVLKANSATATGLEWATDSSGMTNPMTTTGDVIYSSSGSTPARLGIGSTGQILTVSGGVPAWAAAPTSQKSFSLLNSGGTALTGAATITVSGLSNVDELFIMIRTASSASASSFIRITFNSDTGANYYSAGPELDFSSTYAAGDFNSGASITDTYIQVARMSGSANSQVSGGIWVSGLNKSGVKPYMSVVGSSSAANSGQGHYYKSGIWNNTATLTSVSITSSTGNFDTGTLYLFGAS
jgi:hypothetical protein